MTSGGRVTIKPRQVGLGPDLESLARDLAFACVSGKPRTAKLQLIEVQPRLTTEAARAMGVADRISTFTTTYSSSNKQRVNNVHLIATAFNNKLVPPGGVFSFNGTVGERTAAKGYQEAPAIVNGKLVPQLGGGICQVGTTFFNTVFFSGLPIVERRNHSFYISHYPKGRDCTVSWGGPDFKWQERHRRLDPDPHLVHELVAHDLAVRHRPGLLGRVHDRRVHRCGTASGQGDEGPASAQGREADRGRGCGRMQRHCRSHRLQGGPGGAHGHLRVTLQRQGRGRARRHQGSEQARHGDSRPLRRYGGGLARHGGGPARTTATHRGVWPKCSSLNSRACRERPSRRLQLARLRTVLARVYVNVPLYRRKFDEAGFRPEQLETLDDLARVPFTVKDDLRSAYPYGMFAVPLRDIVRVHSSSGTTGQISVVGYTKGDIERWSDLMARTLACAGATADDVVQVTYGYGLFTGGLGVHYGSERLGALTIPVSGGNTEPAGPDTEGLRRHGAGVHAVLRAADRRDRGGDGRRRQESAAAGRRLRRGAVERGDARPDREDDGASRPSTSTVCPRSWGPGVASECLHGGGLHVFEDHFLIEIVDPDTLEPVPDGADAARSCSRTLTKEGIPVVRYRTRDISRIVPGPVRVRPHVPQDGARHRPHATTCSSSAE